MTYWISNQGLTWNHWKVLEFEKIVSLVVFDWVLSIRIMASELGMLRIERSWRGCRAAIEWGMAENKEDEEGFENAPRVVKGWSEVQRKKRWKCFIHDKFISAIRESAPRAIRGKKHYGDILVVLWILLIKSVPHLSYHLHTVS